uniref:Uncharacterized protein n=1 Tax=Panagrolaimus sp. ES5 TaxID=591445 RepID=A0AC34F3Q8_9BILA
MASGASPSSNQRSSLPDDPLSADAIVAIGRKSRNTIRRTHSTKNEFSDSASPPSFGLVNCVVCGDRACSHYYYGVAACHGCKCFFWRSVKQQAQYVCRYDKNCNITVNARNACRFCRFQRCINAGMQPESVRMSKDEKQIKPKKHSMSAQNSPEMSFDTEQPSPKKPNNTAAMLLAKICEIEAKAQEEADFNENSGTSGINNLQEIFDFPECMSAYRTKIMYCVRLHSVTKEEMDFCKFRTLTYASDYIRALSLLDSNFISPNDQISLLRSCYGSLTIFNIVYGTVNATRETSLLCFPTGITVSKNEEMKTNSFVNHFLVANIIDTLIPNVHELCLSDCEYMLVKAIIVLNDEARGLSSEGKLFVSSLRDKVHAALYEQCQRDKSDADAPLRFAKLLHLLPKISLLARDLAEHIKVDHTFNSDMRRVDPLFFELFGDIFQEERQHVADTTTRPAFSQFHKYRKDLARSRLPEKLDKHIDVKSVQKISSNAYRNEDGNGIGHYGTNARLSSSVSFQNPLLKTNRGVGNFYSSQGNIYPQRNVWSASNDTQSSFMMEEEATNEQFYGSNTNNYSNQIFYNNDNTNEQNVGPMLTNVQLLPM